jgi:acyl-coenzyme A thioesterase 13
MNAFMMTRAVGPIRRASSFLARAREANDPSVLLGRFRSKGQVFDQCLDDANFEVCAIGADGVECTLTVTPELCNNYKTLHGGATSTLVDVVGTLALLGKDPTRPGVSVEMNQSFTSAAKVGDQLRITGKVLRSGKTLGFTEVNIYSADDSARLIATGRHTKFLDVVPPKT